MDQLISEMEKRKEQKKIDPNHEKPALVSLMTDRNYVYRTGIRV